MNRTTLTHKLFFRITPIILVTIGAIGLFVFHSATREIQNVYDAQLINSANILWSLVDDEFKEEEGNGPKKMEDFDLSDQLSFNDDADDYAEARMFRIWKSNTIQMYSGNTLPKDVPLQKNGFSNVQYKNEDWRLYTLCMPETPICIEVGEKIALRETLVHKIVIDLLTPLLALIPLISLLLWLGINSGLGVIRMMVTQIQRRSPDDLSAITTSALPRDLVPLGSSINQLLFKLEHSLTAERHFADHVAHQLRTPLAGLTLLIQMLERTADEQERRVILEDLAISSDKASYLVQQLLRATRVSHQPIKMQSVSLYHVTASIIAGIGILANQKEIDISLDGDENAYVLADSDLLQLMIVNLVDNAVKYTPEHGRVQINIVSRNDMWCLSICDTGPGIAQEEHNLVFERFYRANPLYKEGTGLGLAIVADVIQRLNGLIDLKTPASGQGLLVEVSLKKA